MSRSKKPLSKLALLEIIALNKKGNGVGFLGLNSIEVPFGLPQDLVRAEIRPSKKRVGLLQEIINPSSLRQEPLCRHFGDCGGCRFQNLPYQEQLKIKETDILALFAPFINKAEIRPIIGCESIWEYRNKMEFTFSEDLAGNRYLGLIKASSKGRVLPLSECHLVSPWFTQSLEAVRSWWAASDLRAFSMKGTGHLRTLTLREAKSTHDRMAVLTVSGNLEYALSPMDLEKFVESLKNFHLTSIFLREQVAVKGVETKFNETLLYGADHIREKVSIQNHEFTFHVSPTAFFQPNTRQAEKLYEEAIKMAHVTSDTVLYDLYCGTGTLGIIAAKKVKCVIGVEINPDAICDAKNNAKLNGIDNITFFAGSVGHVLSQLRQGDRVLPFPDIVVVDPPRSGLDEETIKCLIEMKPVKILYVSCNPLTQSKDVGCFVEEGYRIVSLQPIDQFPHTPHVENIVLLQKSVS